jgi:hypothetical protein
MVGRPLPVAYVPGEQLRHVEDVGAPDVVE